MEQSLSNRADIATRFQPGESGNPGGKPTKSRNRLQTRFLYDLAEDYDKHGLKAIVTLRKKKPAEYIKAIVALMPKQVEIQRDLEELSDEQLAAALIAARAILASQNTRTGNILQGEAQSLKVLQTLPEAVDVP